MADFVSYFDDSGTHREANSAVAACFVASVAQWKLFETEWREIQTQEGFDSFHMADVVSRIGQFRNWDEDKQLRVLVCAHWRRPGRHQGQSRQKFGEKVAPTAAPRSSNHPQVPHQPNAAFCPAFTGRS